MKSFVVERNVDVQNIPVLEDSMVRNSVADDFIYRCADRFGEVVVVQRRGICLKSSLEIDVLGKKMFDDPHLSFYASLVHDFVNIIGCNARLDRSSRNIQDFS